MTFFAALHLYLTNQSPTFQHQSFGQARCQIQELSGITEQLYQTALTAEREIVPLSFLCNDEFALQDDDRLARNELYAFLLVWTSFGHRRHSIG